MSSHKIEESAYAPKKAMHLPGTVLSRLHSPELWQTIKAKTSIFLPLISILALTAGILMGALSDSLSNAVEASVEAFIEGYSLVAPLMIFIVLAPVLSRMFSTKQGGRFGFYAIGWLSVTKILCMLWAVLFTVVVFGLPVVSESSSSVGDALIQSSNTVLSTLTGSLFFWAIYAAIAIGVVAVKVKPLASFLEKGVTSIEYAGNFMQPLIPGFMFSVGVYVQGLPRNLADQIGLKGTLTGLQPLNILGLDLDPSTPTGMVMAYIVGSLLVAVACFGWHFAILALAKHKEKRFSLRDYFTNYWVRAYPLLWSTSSETIATPLNLYILRARAPWIHRTVRRLVAGAGSVLCTNGTLICVYILLGLVGSILGIHFSLVQLLLSIPIAFLISFGIPGIPGELLLFAGPLSAILGISPELTPLFLALYIGLQIGLPDSFRTGSNTTNNYVYCVLLNQPYEKRFLGEEPEDEG